MHVHAANKGELTSKQEKGKSHPDVMEPVGGDVCGGQEQRNDGVRGPSKTLALGSDTTRSSRLAGKKRLKLTLGIFFIMYDNRGIKAKERHACLTRHPG